MGYAHKLNFSLGVRRQQRLGTENQCV